MSRLAAETMVVEQNGINVIRYPTLHAAHAASPRANVGGISTENHALAVVVGRRRRVAYAHVNYVDYVENDGE